MNYLVNAQEMKACDTRTIEYYQIPSMVLMERAALAFTEELLNAGYDMTMTGLVCGMGNNGGDGLAVARMLHEKGFPVKVFLVGDEARATEQTKQQLAIIRKYKLQEYFVKKEFCREEFAKQLEACTLLVDGIFGVGISRDITGYHAEIIEEVNKCSPSVAAIDIPSGIDAGNGKVSGCAVQADMTVTFAFAKAGLVLYPGAVYAGKVIVRDIGITVESFDGSLPYLYTCSTKEVLAKLPVRKPRTNKGSYGKAVLIVGSHGMAGAAYLAAMAACRMGCGLVRIVTPEANREIIQTLIPEAVLTTYPDKEPAINRQELLEVLQWGDVIGIGSGLGISKASEYLLSLTLKHAKVPLIIDGDGLNLLQNNMELLAPKKVPIAITPHLGEMSRLTGKPVAEIQQTIVQTASEFAEKYQVCCVLKDARTIVTGDRPQAYVNLTGNNGMATGGSGDVLMGMLASLAAQKMDLFEAAVAAVHLHGCAGDRAADRAGRRGMTARDILEEIAGVLTEKHLD